jgi:hypothetical protein
MRYRSSDPPEWAAPRHRNLADSPNTRDGPGSSPPSASWCLYPSPSASSASPSAGFRSLTAPPAPGSCTAAGCQIHPKMRGPPPARSGGQQPDRPRAPRPCLHPGRRVAKPSRPTPAPAARYSPARQPARLTDRDGAADEGAEPADMNATGDTCRSASAGSRALRLVLRWRISAPSGRRAATAQGTSGPAPGGHLRATPPRPRAKPTVSERATLARGRGSWEWAGSPGWPALLDYSQMRHFCSARPLLTGRSPL